MAAIIGRKVGMTQMFGEDGQRVPLTLIEAGPCPVTQVKTAATDGYEAVQLGFGVAKPRRLTSPERAARHPARAAGRRPRPRPQPPRPSGRRARRRRGHRRRQAGVMGVPILNPEGLTVGDGALAETLASQEIKPHLIHEAVVADL